MCASCPIGPPGDPFDEARLAQRQRTARPVLSHCRGCGGSFDPADPEAKDDPAACSWACWQEALELERLD